MVKTAIHQEIGEIKIDVAVLKEMFVNMQKDIKSINKAIAGNGQPGLVQKMDFTEDRFEKHIVEDAQWKGKKDGAIYGIRLIFGSIISILVLAVGFLAFI